MIQKFEFKELDMKGAYEITPFYATDERGGFIKDYNIDAFKQNGIDDFSEKRLFPWTYLKLYTGVTSECPAC